MKKFEYMKRYDYEQLVYFYDKASDLMGITCIHDTTLGPALGGTRLWNYETEEDAVIDVLRLARGMTYKAACAGLNLGGGKTVLMGDIKEISSNKVRLETYFRALGRYVESLNGRYITAEDINTTTSHMNYIAQETKHVVGLKGRSGNPSPITAWGAFAGIKASLKEVYGNTSIVDRTFLIQGTGQTGYYLTKYLLGYDHLTGTFAREKAKKIYFSEINNEYIERMKREHPEVEFVDKERVYEIEVDVFSPCALGGILTKEKIPKLKYKIIAGTANNQLENDECGEQLKDEGILYAPDYVINAGGLINVYHEIKGYNKESAIEDTEKIYGRLEDIYRIARGENIATSKAADRFAKERIESIKEMKSSLINR